MINGDSPVTPMDFPKSVRNRFVIYVRSQIFFFLSYEQVENTPLVYIKHIIWLLLIEIHMERRFHNYMVNNLHFSLIISA